MTDQLKRRLDALRGIAPRLNSVVDDANKMIKNTEKVLVDDVKIGISANARFDEYRRRIRDPEDGRVTEEEIIRNLSFDRVSGAYCIHITEQTYRDDGFGNFSQIVDTGHTLWSQCDRETRLKALNALPALLDNIASEAALQISVASEASAKVEELSSEESGTSNPLDEAVNAYHWLGVICVSEENDGTSAAAKPDGENIPHELELARRNVIGFVLTAHRKTWAGVLETPIAVQTGQWLVVVSPNEDGKGYDAFSLTVVSLHNVVHPIY